MFAFVGTHNHFALDRGGHVFKQTAPVIKLGADATEDDHLGVLALLNSSTLGFWMQQICHNKGGPGGGSSKDEKWHDFYEFDGTKLKATPLTPAKSTLPLARAMDTLVQEACKPLLSGLASGSVALSAQSALKAEIGLRLARRRTVLAQMRALQEEIDWLVYELYGLVPTGAGLTRPPENLPELYLGHRPFEIALARRMSGGDLKTAWFERHGSTPTTEIPANLPKHEREVIAARLALIESVPEIALIEQPEYKRRWSADDLDAQTKAELRNLLLDLIEAALGRSEIPVSVRSLAHSLEREPEVRTLAQVFAGQVDVRLADLVGEILGAESVPAFAACRYSETGFEKRAVWEKVWDFQRREDAGEKPEIPSPPKYQSKDFIGNVWSHRGKLDVPKERFVSYPGCASSNDPTDVYGWAGWDHLQRARALTALYERRKTEEAWDRERLLPLLTGVQELIPWLIQWHNEPSEEYGGERPGETFRAWLEAELAALVVSPKELAAWRPKKKKAGRGATGRVTNPKAKTLRAELAGEDELDGTLSAVDSVELPPPLPPPRPRSDTALDPDRILAAVRERGGQATLAELVEALAAPQRTVRAAADALVESGRLVQTKQRPITYAIATGKGAS